MTRKLSILIVDDNEMMVKTLRDIFRVKGYQAEAAYSGPEALAKIEAAPFDCVLSDIKMPDLNGVELYRAIKSIRPELPVVLMTAYATDNLVQEGLAEGIVAVLNKPLDINLLLNFFSFLGRERSVAIVDDDPSFSQMLAEALQRHNFRVRQISEAEHIAGQLEAEGQVVLLDLKLKESSGLDVLQEIRKSYPKLPVVLITGYRKELSSAVEVGLSLGAAAYLYKPFRIKTLLQLLSKIYHQELSHILGRSAGKSEPR